MVKVTRIELSPDDPIFTGGPQIFVPVSRPALNKPEPEPDWLSTDESDDDAEGGEL